MLPAALNRETMRFIKQNPDTRNCGQIAVAMLTNRTVEEIQTIVGHSHGTKTRELISALRGLGYGTADRCHRYIRQFTPFGLAQVHSNQRPGWHWVAVGAGYVWDGNGYGEIGAEVYETCARLFYNDETVHITSYLGVWPIADGGIVTPGKPYLVGEK